VKKELELHSLLLFLIFLLELIHQKEFVDDLENIFLNRFSFYIHFNPFLQYGPCGDHFIKIWFRWTIKRLKTDFKST
jgi:hypothetical protein